MHFLNSCRTFTLSYFCVRFLKSNLLKYRFICASQVDNICLLYIKGHDIAQKPLLQLPIYSMKENVRFKSKKKAAQIQSDQYESSDEEESDEENILDERTSKKFAILHSLRIDNTAKAAFKISKRKAEDLIWQNKILLNGKRLPKKSVDVKVNDELQLLQEPFTDAASPVIINKVIIADIKVLEGSSKFEVHFSEEK